MFYSRIQNKENTDVDISTNFLFRDKFGLNVVYRLQDHYGVFANFQILNAVMISLGYGNQTSLRTEGLATNDGIFQITLRYENVLKRGKKLFTPFLTPSLCISSMVPKNMDSWLPRLSWATV